MVPAHFRHTAALALLFLALAPASGRCGTDDHDEAAPPLVNLRGKAIPLITIVGSSEGPKFKERTAPEYPFVAKKRGQEGAVMLRLSIDEKGILQNIEVVEASDPVFIDAAVASVKKSFFVAAKSNNRSVASEAILPIYFRLEK